MLSLFRTPRAKSEETEVSAICENTGKAPADATVRDRPSVAGGEAKKSPILTRSRAAKGE